MKINNFKKLDKPRTGGGLKKFIRLLVKKFKLFFIFCLAYSNTQFVRTKRLCPAVTYGTYGTYGNYCTMGPMGPMTP